MAPMRSSMTIGRIKGRAAAIARGRAIAGGQKPAEFTPHGADKTAAPRMEQGFIERRARPKRRQS